MNFFLELFIVIMFFSLGSIFGRKYLANDAGAGLIVQGTSDTITTGYGSNPIIKKLFTADPAALVYKDTFFLFTGHDEATETGTGYVMNDWHVFSSTDMVSWKDHGACLKLGTFKWATCCAWAGQCIYRNGKFYWYVPVSTSTAFGIGVAVSDNPEGPYTDALGKALIDNTMTTKNSSTWEIIDPTVFIDDDGQAYLYWGNSRCHYVKLKSNMTEIDGAIKLVSLTNYTEAPWLTKKNGTYYLAYAGSWYDADNNWYEVINYCTSTSPTGPWKYRGKLNDTVQNSNTNHEAILDFKGKSYFVYHNGALPTGGSYRRSVCIDTLHFNADGTISQIVQTVKGVKAVTNAGPDQTDHLCGVTSTTLSATAPLVGTGYWKIVSGEGGVVSDSLNSASTFSGVSGNTYTLGWNILDYSKIVSSDTVLVTFNAGLTTANAGADQTGLDTTYTELAANSPTVGTGKWTIVDGTGGVLENENNPTTGFSGTFATSYTLRWTISSLPCTESSDDVVVSFNGAASSVNLIYLNPDQKLTIFPNPVSNQKINFDLSKLNFSGKSKLQIINALGEQVFVQDCETGSVITINTFFKPGIYLVNLAKGSSVVYGKFTVE
jgi:hypothetical protein